MGLALNTSIYEIRLKFILLRMFGVDLLGLFLLFQDFWLFLQGDVQCVDYMPII